MKARHAMTVALPCVLFAGATIFLAGSLWIPHGESHGLLRFVGTSQRIEHSARGQTGFADVVERVRPAVIGIRTKVAASAGPTSPLGRFGQLDEPKNES